MPPSDRAFTGVRILDFSQVLAGPFAVMQLALLGAEVIKVEQPNTGDQTRSLMNEGGHESMSPSFMGMNLNKKSLTLNLKHDEAATIVRKLLPETDVLVENFRSGTMARLGLDYDAVKVLKPDLIYCSITGYGQTGAKAKEAAYDGAIQASSGMMSQTGHPQTGPTRTGYMPVDMSTALNTAFAISSALYRKERTGKGQYIDLAMMDTAVVMQAVQFANWLNQGSLVGLGGNSSPTRQPTADVFPTSDGYIQVTALSQPQVEILFRELEISGRLDQPEYATTEARIQNPQPVSEAVSVALCKKTTAEWIQQLATAGIPVAEVRELPDVSEDPQFEGRAAFVTLPSPINKGESIRLAQSGFVMNEAGPETTSGPPLLGEHSEEILRSIGYDDDKIVSLREAGTI
ncbi:MAG: CoA transferase [Gammaproteobacteria bacterium]|nr:CoA transferase [Gammaproteobacteria bacterium]